MKPKVEELIVLILCVLILCAASYIGISYVTGQAHAAPAEQSLLVIGIERGPLRGYIVPVTVDGKLCYETHYYEINVAYHDMDPASDHEDWRPYSVGFRHCTEQDAVTAPAAEREAGR